MNFNHNFKHKLHFKFAPHGPAMVRTMIPVGFILALVLSLVLVQGVASPGHEGAKQVSSEQYQQSLQSQVDSGDGSPVSGRDPANQSQTSLAAAAATPSGTGTRTDTPAAGATGSTGNKVSPDQVYGSNGDQQANGINSAGCFYDYGVPGQECMPAHMANADGKLDCRGVKMHFPNGIKVSGTDRFSLDTNGDKIACGAGDKL